MPHIALIDEAACLAHGDCAELAPEVFRVDDVARVIGSAESTQLIRVAEACPAAAISVVDQQTGEQIYP